MCGRFVTTSSVHGAVATLLEETWSLPENYNVAPTEEVPVVREREGRRELVPVRWGMVAPRSPVFGGGKPVINARIETVASNGLFKGPFEKGRVIVPAAGYYEWVRLPDGSKQPHFIEDPDSDLAMAGVVRAWRDPAKGDDDPDKWRLSMSIITRDAHVAPGEVHDRMPACLTPDAYDAWLGGDLDAAEVLSLLDRVSVEVAHDLMHYPVSKAVNSPRNNGPELIAPLGS